MDKGLIKKLTEYINIPNANIVQLCFLARNFSTIFFCILSKSVLISVPVPSFIHDTGNACLYVLKLLLQDSGLSPLKTRSKAESKQKVGAKYTLLW